MKGEEIMFGQRERGMKETRNVREQRGRRKSNERAGKTEKVLETGSYWESMPV